MNTEVREIVKDKQGVEYYLIKANRVNWIVERISDGARLEGKAYLFSIVGAKEVDAPVVDLGIRIGAMVRVNPKSDIWKYAKFNNAYEFEQKFVIIGFGKIPGEWKVMELGGNTRNTYYGIHGKDLVLA